MNVISSTREYLQHDAKGLFLHPRECLHIPSKEAKQSVYEECRFRTCIFFALFIQNAVKKNLNSDKIPLKLKNLFL